MVNLFAYAWLLLAVEDSNASQPLKSGSLPEPVRQIAYMALLGIALLGMMMIVATLLGGHWVRRWGDRVRRTSVPPDVMLPRQRTETQPKEPSGNSNEGDTLGPGDDTIGG